MTFDTDAFLAGAGKGFFYMAGGSFLAARPGLAACFSSSSLLLLESSESFDSGEESESSLLLLLEDSTYKTRRPLKAGGFGIFVANAKGLNWAGGKIN
jgi:hypothetical protein